MRRLFKIGSDRHDVGYVSFSWHPEGNFIASAGANGIVQITDRNGGIVDEIPLTSNSSILNIEWDKDGDYLAILQDGNSIVPLWSLASRRVIPLETNLVDPTFLCWSKTGPQLAIGTAKGNLMIYNKVQKKKVPVVGKHAKRIVCGGWSNSGNKLVLGSDDRTITISNEAGDTLIHTELKYVPYEASFTNRSAHQSRQSNRDSVDDTVSANLGGKSLLLLNILDDNEDPMELTFATSSPNGPCRYGDLLHYEWYNDNMLIFGFSGGWIIVVSTELNEIGEEKYATQIFSSKLTTFSYNPLLKRVATAGSDGVRVLDTKDFKEIKGDYVSYDDMENGKVTKLQWSPDGQILSIATSAGNVYNFLAKRSVLCASYCSTVAYLSSLREVSVVHTKRKTRPVEVTLMLEPAVIAVGAKHVAGGMNNKVYYHRISPSVGGGGPPINDIVNEQEYVSKVRTVQLNTNFAAVLTDTKVVLHPIEPVNAQQQHQQTKTFPIREEGAFSKVTCIALTDDFLYYGTEAGAVEVFYLGEWVLLAGAELRLDSAIKALYPNSSGTRCVVVNASNEVVLFNPVTGGGVNQSITKFESAPAIISNIIWDVDEKNVIMIIEGRYIHTYVYIASSMKGPLLIKLGPVEISADGGVVLKPDKAEIPPSNTILLSACGQLTTQNAAGGLNVIMHPFFDHMDASRAEGHGKRDKSNIPAVQQTRFCQALALHRLEDAWQAALDIDKREYWLALSGKAMEMMNVELAIRIYRQLGDAGMVLSLQRCLHTEDKHLLGGYISLFFSDYHSAQELFLLSSNPVAALDMQCDLMRWDQALKLAHNLAPDRVPYVSIKYGQQLEFCDDSDRAMRLFESALNAVDNDGMGLCPEALVSVAMAGIARCNLRLGNIRQGIRLATEVGTATLYSECGDILELHKQYSEAASMFIKAGNHEKAAEIYVRHLITLDKNRLNEAIPIFQKVSNSQLNSSLAKACIAAGRFDEAAKAYERAKDFDKVVEIKLRNLDQVQQAFDLVREMASSEGATLVGNYCLEMQNYRGAIEFFFMAKKSDEAFKLAQSHNHVDVYAGLLGENIPAEDSLKLANFYEKAQEFGKAGKYYSLCTQYQRALKLFIQCGDREIDAAIDVVGKCQNEHLTHQLIDFLVGEKDGIPKDPNYIYRLYMALKKYDDAAKTAAIIARQEQDMGNYSVAHGVVTETIRKLEDDGIKVPSQLRSHFVLLHSYLIVKRLVKRGDHTGAARMLLRVAESVSKFPQHLVPILTSTVVECQRAGLKASSYEYAAMLMRPEYRSNIDTNLKRKIEAIVRRRSANSDDVQEELSPCPISGNMISHTQLTCPTTRDALPMCIITGRHMLIDDWCFCPNSKMPALLSEYRQFIQDEHRAATEKEAAETKLRGDEYVPSRHSVVTATDPIVGLPIALTDLEKTSAEDAMKYIQKYNNNVQECKQEKVEEGEAAEAVSARIGAPEKGTASPSPRN